MKKFIIEFLKRGAIFASLGPVIVAIVYIFLGAGGVVETVSVTRLVREILTSTFMAFIAAGVSSVYPTEKLQLGMAALIQGAVLFLDYIGIYLLNGWLPLKWQAIALFTAIFAGVFLIIWAIVYLCIRNNIKKMNKQLNG